MNTYRFTEVPVESSCNPGNKQSFKTAVQKHLILLYFSFLLCFVVVLSAFFLLFYLLLFLSFASWRFPLAILSLCHFSSILYVYMHSIVLTKSIVQLKSWNIFFFCCRSLSPCHFFAFHLSYVGFVFLLYACFIAVLFFCFPLVCFSRLFLICTEPKGKYRNFDIKQTRHNTNVFSHQNCCSFFSWIYFCLLFCCYENWSKKFFYFRVKANGFDVLNIQAAILQYFFVPQSFKVSFYFCLYFVYCLYLISNDRWSDEGISREFWRVACDVWN